MKDLIIIGAGGYGREVLEIALDIQEQVSGIEWRVKGFITDIPGDFNEKDTLGYQIIDDISHHKIQPNAVYAFAIADIPFKKKITTDFMNRGAEFATLIHPTSIIGRSSKIGYGSILTQYTVITANVTVGNFVRLAGGSIGHDAVIDDYSVLSGDCAVCGRAVIGKDVFMGTKAIICPHAKVGDGAIVGAGSVVIRNVKPGITVFGNPARKLDL